MVTHMLPSLLLFWSLNQEIYTKGLPCHDPKERSWSNQNLYSVPLDLDVRLRRLNLSNNFIRQLHTLGLPYLEQLDLSSNQLDLISEGVFENLAQLEELNLSRNALNNNLGRNSKALQSISRLKTLDISMNGLSDEAVELYLRNKSSLDQLKMSGNALTRLSRSMFKDSRKLRTISIDNNLISVIDQGTFEPLSRLEVLNLAKNNLAHICDFKLHQVKYLNLSRNSMEFFVTREDERLYRLEILDLSFNNLLYFPIVPKLNRLRYLYLQNNMVGTLTLEAAMVSEANSLYDDIVYEDYIPFANNHLHSTWRLMPLTYVDLSYNHFSTFPLETLSLLSSLEMLNFSHNCVQNIVWNIRNYSESKLDRQIFFPSLKYLDLQSNGLTHISPLFVEALTQIETLNLQGNSLQPCVPVEHLDSFKSKHPVLNPNTSCVTFGHLRTLKHLNLRDNNIEKLHLNMFQKTSLVSLNLAKNAHMVMHPGALEEVQRTLQSLTISEINMTGSDLSLPCMPALAHLNISNNRLDTIPNSLRCSPLTEIDIRNNILGSLNHALILNLSTHLEIMYISGNDFNCCDSRWLSALNELKIKVPDISDAECYTSENNILLNDYLENPMNYCFFHTNAQKIHFGQMFIITLFVAVTLTTFIIFSRKLCCTQTSFVV